VDPDRRSPREVAASRGDYEELVRFTDERLVEASLRYR
jgi:hypothetical protein